MRGMSCARWSDAGVMPPSASHGNKCWDAIYTEGTVKADRYDYLLVITMVWTCVDRCRSVFVLSRPLQGAGLGHRFCSNFVLALSRLHALSVFATCTMICKVSDCCLSRASSIFVAAIASFPSAESTQHSTTQSAYEFDNGLQPAKSFFDTFPKTRCGIASKITGGGRGSTEAPRRRVQRAAVTTPLSKCHGER